MAIDNTDPRNTGTKGLSGLKGLNIDRSRLNTPNRSNEYYKNKRAENLSSTPAVSYAGYSGAGDSKYDKEGLLSQANLENLPNYRGERQPWLLQVTNGVAKGAVLAGTTFLDGTLGLVVGGIDAIAEKDKSKLWDNPFSQAMKAINDYAEEQIPNYYTDEELKREWYRNLFTGNFIGDKLLKNMGFTVGAYYSGSVWAKPLSMFNLIKNAKVGSMVASGLGASISAVNEGRIEALNNSTDWYNLQKAQLDDAYSQKVKDISVFEGTESYNALLQRAQDSYNTSLQDLQEKRLKVGNTDLMFNLPILLASNIVEFGKLYSRGFSTAAKLNKIAGDPGNYTTRGLGVLSKIGTGIKASTAEGTEEVLQQLAANIAGYAYQPENYNLSMNQAEIDNNAEQQTVDWIKATASGLNETLNDNSTWEQWFIGAFTGALGMPTFGRANNENAWIGKNRLIGLSGGAVGAINDLSEEMQNTEALVRRMNERVQSQKFLNYYRGLIRHNKFQNDMNRAASEGKAKEFKDAEYAQMISDISMFAKAGKLNDYRDLLLSAFDTSDENLQSIIENTTTTQTNNNEETVTVGPFIDSNGNSILTTEGGKDKMISKLTEAKNEMLKAVSAYSKINEQLTARYGNALSDSQREELIWLDLLSKNQKERAISLAESTKPTLKNIANSMRAELATLEEKQNCYNEPLSDTDATRYERLAANAKQFDSLSGRGGLELATTLAANSALREFIKSKVTADTISKDYTGTIDEFKSDINDIKSLLKDSTRYSDRLTDYLNNPEKLNKEQDKQAKNEAKKAEKTKVLKIDEALSNAKTFTDIRNSLSQFSDNQETVDKAIRKSTNPIVKDYVSTLQSLKNIKAKTTTLDNQLKSDIYKILDNFSENANTIEDLDIKGALIADPEILRSDSNETIDALEKRSEKAVQIISQLLNDTKKDNNSTTVVTNNDIDDFNTEGEVYNPETDDLGDEGEEEVSENTNVESSKSNIKKEPIPEGVEPSFDEEGDVEYFLTSEEADKISKNQDAKESTRSIQENPSNIENNKETLIRPSTSQYDLTGMARNPNGIVFNEVPEAGRAARQYLAQNGPEGKDAFEWINEGGLQSYLTNEGKLYAGIDPRFSETTPVVFIKNQDDTYSPIAILWESDNKIDSFAGLREITDKVREEYQSNKVEDTPYVSPNIEIPAENVNITSGRVPYTNDKSYLVKDAIVGTEISTENPEIIVVSDGQLFGGTGRISDYRVSGDTRSGMAYISIPNARRGGFKGNTLVPIIPKRYSEVMDNQGTFISTVKATINNMAESVNSRDINKFLSGLKKLSDYLLLSNLDVKIVKDDGDILASVVFKEIERDDKGKVIKINKNGKEVAKSKVIISVLMDAPPDVISSTITEALLKLQVPIRVNKNLVKNRDYNRSLVEQGLVDTYCPNLKSQAAYFTFTAPTVQKPSEVTTPVNTQEKISPNINTSDDLFDLDNFGISDVITKKMTGSTIPIEPTSESLSKYGLELNKEYSAYDTIKVLNEISSPISSKVVDILMRAAREMRIKYTIKKGNGTDFGASRGNQISIYTDPSDSKFTHVVLHETIHSFTSWLLNPENSSKLTSSEKQTVAEIQRLFETARKNGVTNEFGASTSIDEFVSELANPEFANQLSRIKVEGKKSLLGRLKEKIKELINKFLGRNYEKQYSNVKDELEKLLEQAISYREVYDSEFLMSNYTKEELKILRNASRDNEGHLLAPNGKPTNLTEKQYAQVRTKAFKDWFGNWENDPTNASKVVDENGEPLVVYHVSKEKFNVFDKTKTGSGLGLLEDEYLGFYFTNINLESSIFITYAVFLNIRTLADDKNFTLGKEFTSHSLKHLNTVSEYTRNADGHINRNNIGYNNELFDEIIVFDSNQIKSATENNGEFSRTNNNIYYMRPQPKYLGSPQEISNTIESYRNIYSINRGAVQNAVDRINEAAGKTIAKLGRGSLHEGMQAYKVDIIEEPTLDTLTEVSNSSLLKYSKQEVGEPMTDFDKEELINFGYSEDWIETATRDEINYARVCAGV